ncbi:lactose-binding lectin l-2-like [Cheilinus undulatus]|uniref:lactose-binding lectin l-2-like n=1 Tax=Cheilinus undulatus TaxID=241271 RepID=UPI001BD22C1A|nr:lactose-binding lectin l-2-like [Cheilinus undulatus]
MMQLFLFLSGLALVAVSPLAAYELEHGHCSSTWYNFRGRCYKYMATRMTWSDAEHYCVSQRANLVSVHSEDEHNFVRFLIRSFDPAQGRTWMGLTDIHREGRWLWSDGCPANFFFWSAGEPNNKFNEDCAHFNFGSYRRWNDVPCRLSYSFVCATSTDCR